MDPIYKMSREELQKKIVDYESKMPPELKQKLGEIAKQAVALPRPTKLDSATLRSIKDEDLDHAISWYVKEKLYGKGKSENATLDTEPRGVRVFYMTWLVEAEVANGGFNQYFWNSSSAWATQTPDALAELGAVEAAELLRGAIALAAKEAPMREKLKAHPSVLQGFSESYNHSKLEEYDAAFAKVTIDLQKRRANYVRSHEDLFLSSTAR